MREKIQRCLALIVAVLLFPVTLVLYVAKKDWSQWVKYICGAGAFFLGFALYWLFVPTTTPQAVSAPVVNEQQQTPPAIKGISLKDKDILSAPLKVGESTEMAFTVEATAVTKEDFSLTYDNSFLSAKIEEVQRQEDGRFLVTVSLNATKEGTANFTLTVKDNRYIKEHLYFTVSSEELEKESLSQEEKTPSVTK